MSEDQGHAQEEPQKKQLMQDSSEESNFEDDSEDEPARKGPLKNLDQSSSCSSDWTANDADIEYRSAGSLDDARSFDQNS
jgi:hypothetical protein